MKIDNIRINGVGGISDLSIQFNSQMNILCGPNGIGKTTILEAIAHCFISNKTPILKRHSKSNSSCITTQILHDSTSREIIIRFQEFDPNENAYIHGNYELSMYLLSLKTTRTFSYIALDSVKRDAAKDTSTSQAEAMKGVSLDNIKNWFVNRYLYSAHAGTLTQCQLENFELAKKCFSELNPNFSFSRVNASTNEIMLQTPHGEIYYEYLSSGFKSCISIFFGIIKEIELRFSAQNILAKAFDGVVLIDELELHLHPEWQYKIAQTLIRIFPNTQFIVTTHSPHIIQSAAPQQVIVLESVENETKQRSIPPSKYGFKGWTLDEVLTDVMGMSDTRTIEFQELMNRFSKAIDAENHADGLNAYNEINELLHPHNHIRKLLQLQLAAIQGEGND